MSRLLNQLFQLFKLRFVPLLSFPRLHAVRLFSSNPSGSYLIQGDCKPVFSFPNVQIGVYLQMSDTIQHWEGLDVTNVSTNVMVWYLLKQAPHLGPKKKKLTRSGSAIIKIKTQILLV